MLEDNLQNLIGRLPDPDGARRFLIDLAERFPNEFRRLERNDALLSDVLTLVAFSPLLATTLLQHKTYFAWLERQRASHKVRGKEELLESLARFALTHSTLETNVLLSRFRRRELLRIYLQDIRNLETIAEVTEEISNLADAILENALRIARQDLDNRFGVPLEADEKGRSREARLSVVALGKLGSRELNYSSDIDLLFLYSSEGVTSGSGTRGSVTNREYFVKLAEQIIRLVGQQSGEGAAYRVDMRLRPHGRVGALAVAVDEAVRYYLGNAQPWERQVLIRSRACAGDTELFREFFRRVESSVFVPDESVAEALLNVRLSKERINLEKNRPGGFDVKLGHGGIREIEFIAQALQLAHAGSDEWLRAPHTLISLARLADRGLISETEHTDLADAYAFLRRLEHRLQMEHGLQTHLLPESAERRALLAKKMDLESAPEFEQALSQHANAVSAAFGRIFGTATEEIDRPPERAAAGSGATAAAVAGGRPESNPAFESVRASLEKSGTHTDGPTFRVLRRLSEISPHFSSMIAANPLLAGPAARAAVEFRPGDYASELLGSVTGAGAFAARLAALRSRHSRFMIEIAVAEIFGVIDVGSAKHFQTGLAEASIAAAVEIARAESASRLGVSPGAFPFAVLGLGKLGGNSIDYGSDLDLVLVYDDAEAIPDLSEKGIGAAEFFGKAVEIFVTVLSAMTREGSLYRVDLRLRPDGKNGAPAIGRSAFLAYLETRADLWELLAYVKIRGVGGDPELASAVSAAARESIHKRAAESGAARLRDETRRVRDLLEHEKSDPRRRDADIKYGAGGMLDVYFATRFLQLRNNVPDDPADRSTRHTLRRLSDAGALRTEDFDAFDAGYTFLSRLDHEMRLTLGRSTKFPAANREALAVIARRIGLAGAAELEQELAIRRIEVRRAYESVLES